MKLNVGLTSVSAPVLSIMRVSTLLHGLVGVGLSNFQSAILKASWNIGIATMVTR